jgi:hypothetical protein
MQRLLKICLLAALSCGVATESEAQAKTINARDTARKVMPVRPKKPKAISREASIGLRLRTDGWAIFFDKGYVKSEDRLPDQFYDIRLFQVEFGETKHTKEIKRTNNSLNGTSESTRPVAYGKINNFYSLKLGYGIRKMIAGKPEPGTVSVHFVGVAGLSLGLLKPYYINALVNKGGVISEQTIKYTDTTKNDFLTKPNIIGSAGFSKGLNELKIVPGLHAKVGLHFDIATEKRDKIAIETGFGLEYYTKEIELMALQKSTSLLGNFYASFQYGKRKAK